MKQLIMLFLFSGNMLAQYKQLTLIDSVTQLPVPFVTVKSLEHDQIAYSDNSGQLELKTNKIDSILIEHTGFQTQIWKLDELPSKVYLTKKTVKLRQVTIKKTVENEVKLGRYKFGNGRMHHYENIELFRKIDLSEIQGEYKVKQILIPIEFNDDYDSCYCKVHLFKAISNEYPTEDILTTPIVLDKTNVPKKYMINVETQNLFLTEKLLYVGLECFLLTNRVVLDKIYGLKSYQKQFNASPIYTLIKFPEVTQDRDNYLSFYRKMGTKKLSAGFFHAGLIITTYE